MFATPVKVVSVNNGLRNLRARMLYGGKFPMLQYTVLTYIPSVICMYFALWFFVKQPNTLSDFELIFGAMAMSSALLVFLIWKQWQKQRGASRV